MHFYFSTSQQTKSHTAELRAKPEYHKFLIGKGGGNIRKVRDSTGARIIFPTPEDKDQELITVVGTEEAVREAQKELEALIKSLVSLPRQPHLLQLGCGCARAGFLKFSLFGLNTHPKMRVAREMRAPAFSIQGFISSHS